MYVGGDVDNDVEWGEPREDDEATDGDEGTTEGKGMAIG